MPGAAFVEQAVQIAAQKSIHNLVFEQPLRLVQRTCLQTVVRQKTNDSETPGVSSTLVETYSKSITGTDWTRHFSARIADTDSNLQPESEFDLATIRSRCPESVSPNRFYDQLSSVA